MTHKPLSTLPPRRSETAAAAARDGLAPQADVIDTVAADDLIPVKTAPASPLI
ncbi:MAG: hypothetical protein AB1768_06430 [Pseudomonadota bacterium]